MKRIIGIAIAIVIVAAAIGGGWRYVSAHPARWERLLVELQLEDRTSSGSLSASGVLEAEMVSVTSEIGGRIARIHTGEGDDVEAGQALVELSTSLIDAEIRKAEAAQAVAEAGVALARSAAPPEAIAQAEALVRQAEIATEAARQAWQDAIAIRDAPGQLDIQMAIARNQAALAQKQIEIAGLQAQAADMELALYGRTASSLAEGFEIEAPGPEGPVKVHVPAGPENVSAARVQWNIASQRTWQTYAALNKAQVARDAALQALYGVQAQIEQPIALDSQVNAAEAAYHEAGAAVEIARAALDDLRAGARAEDIAVAQAGVKQAQAGVDALRVQREKMILVAPRGGMVAERTAQVGETLAPGASVMRIANLEEITLTLYVAQDQIGKVTVGQTVDVTVDSFPDHIYQGTISHIADEAEFTPKNIQTKEGRVNMVFAVKVKISNPGHELKPGMPADAVIRTEEANS
jgi:HlyD family secretion protein